MNKQDIINTAIYWIDENGDHIIESPLCPAVAGVDDTVKGAWILFTELLDDHFEELAKARKTGRPAKNKKRTTIDIAPDAKDEIATLAKKLKISYGECVEYLVGYHRMAEEALLKVTVVTDGRLSNLKNHIKASTRQPARQKVSRNAKTGHWERVSEARPTKSHSKREKTTRYQEKA